jgi:hypothetical protein
MLSFFHFLKRNSPNCEISPPEKTLVVTIIEFDGIQDMKVKKKS